MSRFSETQIIKILREHDSGKETKDINLGMECCYNTLQSFWAKFNNMAVQTYYLYHQYPSNRFRAMLGFSFAL